MIEGTTCEFCGKPNHSKSALYSHRKRCKLYQKYRETMETISIAVKNNIINGQEVFVKDVINEATEIIKTDESYIKKKEQITPMNENIIDKTEPKIEHKTDEELTINKSYEKFVRDTIQDMYVQMGEIRRLVRRLVEKKELKEIE